MDLAKILKARQEARLNATPNPRERSLHFLNSLASTLEQDLYTLSQDPTLNEKRLARVAVINGAFENEKQQQSPFLYIQIPTSPGFLLELCADDEISMVRATHVVALFSDVSGHPVRPSLFVAQGQVLERFRVLEEDLVRTQTANRTLSLEQCSELLVTLAFDVLQN